MCNGIFPVELLEQFVLSFDHILYFFLFITTLSCFWENLEVFFLTFNFELILDLKVQK